MNSALVIRSTSNPCTDLVSYMKMLGYLTVTANESTSALKVVSTIRFDVVIICTPTRGKGRRSLAGEIRTLSRSAIVILVTPCEETYAMAKACRYSGVTAVLRAPTSFTHIWRVLEYQRDGFGCHPGWVDNVYERRLDALT